MDYTKQLEQWLINPMVQDKTRTEIEKLIDKNEILASRDFIHVEFNKILSSSIQKPLPSGDKTSDLMEITKYLKECLAQVEREVLNRFSGYSSYRWLWYLRRIPETVFEGNLKTSAPYDAMLADVLSGMVTISQSPISNNNYVRYPIDKTIIKRVLRLAAAARYLSYIHVLLRYAGKSADFFFDGHQALPKVKSNKQLEECIRVYDKRVEKQKGFIFSKLGTGKVTKEISSDFYSDSILKKLNSLLLVFRCEPTYFPLPLSTTDWNKKGLVCARFYFSLIDNTELIGFFDDKRLASLEHHTEFGPLLMLLSLAPLLIVGLEHSMISIPQYGYVLTSLKALNDSVQPFYTELRNALIMQFKNIEIPESLDSLVSYGHLKGSSWPLHCGPFVRIEGDMICLDFAGVSNRFISILEFPMKDDKVANARSDHFEDAVQEVIDKSPWQPGVQLRKIRRREITLNGKKLTDIDAIGEREDSLLVVSCKSIIYTKAYDVGDFRVVRNTRTTVEEAVVYWMKIHSTLAMNMVGDNYDFRQYKKMIFVVCTPFPVFTQDQRTFDTVAKGLSAAVSISELEEWLHQ